jgi:hypothetical protein
MAVARVVTFDGVTSDRVEQIRSRIEDNDRPEGLPATEVLVLHDADAEKAVVVVFFDSEDDYNQGDEVLRNMPADDTPGQRASVSKYQVAARMTA